MWPRVSGWDAKEPFEPTAVLAGMEDAIRVSFEYSLISNVSYSDIS